MKYQVLLFDADGVVLRSSRLFSEQLESEYGIKNEKLQPFFKGVFKDCALGRADLKEELAKVIADWGWQGTGEELLQYWFSKGTSVDTEIVEYIQSLCQIGVRCFMTTNQEKYRSEYLQNFLGHSKVFERVFYSAQIGATKKQPEYFQFVYKHLDGISKNQILLIDDDEENIEAAKIFGFETHFFTTLDGLKKIL